MQTNTATQGLKATKRRGTLAAVAGEVKVSATSLSVIAKLRQNATVAIRPPSGILIHNQFVCEADVISKQTCDVSLFISSTEAGQKEHVSSSY